MITLKGNYFYNKWHEPVNSGPNATEVFVHRYNPSNTNEKLWSLAIDYTHIEELVSSAKDGYKDWRNSSLHQRIDTLKRYQKALIKRKEKISNAISLETGKPLWEAEMEADALASKIDITISEGLPRIKTKQYENIVPGSNASVYYRPLGPTFIIGPFNFPCHLANGQIVSALISGNSIIFKPSEKTCYSAQLMFEALIEANFPKGVVNFLQGDGESVRRVLKYRDIKGVFFTGSKDIGVKIIENTYHHLDKLVCLELGGKNSSFIDKDVNIDYVLEEILKGSFLTTGQRCTSTAIVFVHQSIQDEVIQKFHQISKRIIVDHPIEHKRTPFMGPLIDKKSLNQYLLYMGMAKREGIEEIMRGKLLEKKYPGHYVGPSIHYTKAWNDSGHFLSSEIFGPNCTFLPYSDFEEAISTANKIKYGLAASVFTQDQKKFEYALKNIEAGLINLNRATIGANSKLPFGGVKDSGNYRPAAISTIDNCVYQLSSLKVQKFQASGKITGLMEDSN